MKFKHAAWVKKGLFGVIAGVAATAIATVILSLGGFERWELATWDFRVRTLARPVKTSSEIVMVLLDQNSLDWGSTQMGLTWPWPREIYGAVVDFCNRNQAKSLSFDVLFSEPSAFGVRDDQAFADAVSRYGKVALPVFFSRSSGVSTQWSSDVPKPRAIRFPTSLFQQPVPGNYPRFYRATFPIPRIAKQAAVLCNVNNPPGSGGIHRSIFVISEFDQTVIPSLGIGAYLAAQTAATGELHPGNVQFEDKKIPIDNTGRSILKYRGASTVYTTFSAASVIQSEIRLQNGKTPTIKDRDAFRDKYVFFGFSAPGLMDLRATPIDSMNPGVGIHATVLDNLLSQDFPKKQSDSASFILVLILTVSAGFLVSAFNKPASAGLLIILFLCVPFSLGLVAYQKGVWLLVAFPQASLVLSISFVLLNNYVTQGRQKRFIKNAFKQYLNPQVIEQILENPEKLSLGGERRVLTVFFSDIQDFTTISENLEPEDVAGFLNLYLSAMTNIIQAEGGTIDKYEGDAIMAFWNAPLKVPDHAARAVRAAIKCQKKLAEKRPVFKQITGRHVIARIGINTGPAVVGNMGSQKRFDYTAIGDTVNLAARLENANKKFGTNVLISEATWQMLNNVFAGKRLGSITVKGRKEPVTVYAPDISDYLTH